MLLVGWYGLSPLFAVMAAGAGFVLCLGLVAVYSRHQPPPSPSRVAKAARYCHACACLHDPGRCRPRRIR